MEIEEAKKLFGRAQITRWLKLASKVKSSAYPVLTNAGWLSAEVERLHGKGELAEIVAFKGYGCVCRIPELTTFDEVVEAALLCATDEGLAGDADDTDEGGAE